MDIGPGLAVAESDTLASPRVLPRWTGHRGKPAEDRSDILIEYQPVFKTEGKGHRAFPPLARVSLQ